MKFTHIILQPMKFTHIVLQPMKSTQPIAPRDTKPTGTSSVDARCDQPKRKSVEPVSNCKDAACGDQPPVQGPLTQAQTAQGR